MEANGQTRVWMGGADSPLGKLWAAVSENGLWVVEFGVSRERFLRAVKRRGPVEVIEDADKVSAALNELQEYLAEERREFTLPIDWAGMTEFDKRARQAVLAVPYGQTASYGEIAARIGETGKARAVGHANATNPIPLVIPCHRIIGADGSMVGYGGGNGIETKRWLLKMEGAILV